MLLLQYVTNCITGRLSIYLYQETHKQKNCTLYENTNVIKLEPILGQNRSEQNVNMAKC